MATPERQAMISAAAVDAVVGFCEARSTQVASRRNRPRRGKSCGPA